MSLTARLRVGAFEQALFAVVLAVSTAAGVPGLTQPAQTADTQQLEPTPLWIWYGLYAIGIILCLRHWQELVHVAARAKLVLAVALWALFSVGWSDDPGLTIRRSLALVLTTMAGLLLAARSDRDEIFELVCWVLAAILCFSVVVAVLFPAYGLDHLRGDAWRGVFDTKNELGRIASLTAVLWLLRALARPRRALSLGIVAVAALTIDRSGSRTSLAVVVALGLLVAALPGLRSPGELMVASCAFLAAGVGSVVYWLLEHPGSVLGALGSGNTLTGRTAIWSAVWTMIKRHFWFGYGYSGFWRGINGPSAFVWSVVGSTPPHSHNGFLDTWLDLGALGLLLVASSLVVTFVRAWVVMRCPGSVLMAWPLVFVVFLLLFNLTESALVGRNSLFWMLYVAVAGSVGLATGGVHTPARSAASGRLIALPHVLEAS
jgi:O-antigen ligase